MELIKALKVLATEQPSWCRGLPDLWYRGQSKPPAHLSNKVGKVHRADRGDECPIKDMEIQALWDAGGIGDDTIYEVYDWDLKISRTYSGMSNWGFGVYFSNELPWARRYGDHILVAEITSSIVCINDTDFAKQVENTSGGFLNRYFEENGIDRWEDQAKAFSKLVRKLDKKARALYVGKNAESGQLVAYTKDAIRPRYYFWVK